MSMINAIYSAAKSGQSIEITAGNETYRGVPKVNTKKRLVTLTSGGCTYTVSFDDIVGL